MSWPMSCSWKGRPCREIAIAADALLYLLIHLCPARARAKRITSIAAPEEFGRLSETAFITPAETLISIHLLWMR